jgi:2-oxoisovalerate dehydrogenase E1 component
MISDTTSKIQYDRKNIPNEQLLKLYENMLLPRLIEEKMLILLRQGKISKWFSGIGQEAISVGAASALHTDEMLFTMHRNLGVFTTREVPLQRLLLSGREKPPGLPKVEIVLSILVLPNIILWV